MAQLTITDNEDALARTAAERITQLIERSIAARGQALVSLTGGSTPRKLYALLADARQPWRERIDWGHLHLFWGDERHVPPDHAESNFGMANEVLVRHVPVPAAQVHRMRGELADAKEAARQYEVELVAGFAAARREDRTFDVMLLGLGEDAHIASIFPGSELLQRRPTKGRPTLDQDVGRGLTSRQEGGVAAIRAAHLNAWRITLTPGAILDSRDIVMVVAGSGKAEAVRAALEGPLDETRYPAQLLRPAADRVHWIVDRAAAARLAESRGASDEAERK